MPRVVSAPMLAAMYKPQTEKVVLLLLRIKHASIPEGGVLRFAQDWKDHEVTTFTGDQDPDRVGSYIGTAFDLVLPDDVEERVPAVPLEIANADRRIVDTVRSLPPEQAPPIMALEVVLADSPNTLEVGISDMVLRLSGWDAAVVRADLAADDPLNEAIPGDSHNPITNPGLFRVPVGA